MANVKELKKKIKSTKQTLKITTAMKLVSGAKLAKAQDGIVNARPYAQELELIIKQLASSYAAEGGINHQYLSANTSKKSLVLVISSNKGLCGNYNSTIARKVKEFVKSKSHADVKIVNIGKKVRDLLVKEYNHGKNFTYEGGAPNFEEVMSVGKELAELYVSGEYGKVYVAYNFFNNALSFTTTVKQVLPMEIDESEKAKFRAELPMGHLCDQNPLEILEKIIPESYMLSLYNCVLNAVAAEQGARMGAMESASKNCKQIIKSLTLKMNKMRQAAITTELIEVISGAEALNG